MPNLSHPSRYAEEDGTTAPSLEGDADAPSTYAVYGLTLKSDFGFSYPLVQVDSPADVRFLCRSEAPESDFWGQAECVYATGSEKESGLYRQAGKEVFRFLDGAADFYLRPNRITCDLRDSFYRYGVEIWLLGTVLAYWMERRGLPALHASAVAVDGRAAAFLANSRGGKSSLAATFMQGGHPLLTDDLLPIGEWEGGAIGRPGYPQMRLWPDSAQHFVDDVESLKRVVPHLDKRRVPVGPDGLGTFCDEPTPLDRFYLPERRPSGESSTDIEIEPVSPRDAVIELVRGSFLPNLTAETGRQSERMKRLTKIAQSVPMRRLRYPDGMEHLPRVRDAILNDLM